MENSNKMNQMNVMNDVDLIGMWTNFLPIANLAFAIVFAIVIYSTATGQGLTNYSVKKILPRLVITAIGVNVSFYLCAILTDAINIIAVGIPSLIFNGSETSWNGASTMTETNEMSTAIGGIFGVVLFIAMGGIAAVAVLVTVLALAARQILLSMLVVISPLAVVCAVLPKTQKWFEKWAKTYIQLLAIYPMFMLVWAGCAWFQQEARPDFNDNVTGSIFGFIVDVVAPIIPAVAIYPLLKASGGVMGKLTGAINKSPLGTQGALGKAAKDMDVRRREGFASGRLGGPITNNRLVNRVRSRGKLVDNANKAAREKKDADYVASRGENLNNDTLADQSATRFLQEQASQNYAEALEPGEDEANASARARRLRNRAGGGGTVTDRQNPNTADARRSQALANAQLTIDKVEADNVKAQEVLLPPGLQFGELENRLVEATNNNNGALVAALTKRMLQAGGVHEQVQTVEAIRTNGAMTAGLRRQAMADYKSSDIGELGLLGGAQQEMVIAGHDWQNGQTIQQVMGGRIGRIDPTRLPSFSPDQIQYVTNLADATGQPARDALQGVVNAAAANDKYRSAAVGAAIDAGQLNAHGVNFPAPPAGGGIPPNNPPQPPNPGPNPNPPNPGGGPGPVPVP